MLDHQFLSSYDRIRGKISRNESNTEVDMKSESIQKLRENNESMFKSFTEL